MQRNNQHFNITLIKGNMVNEALSSISKILEWCRKNITGSTKNLNDEFTVRFGDVHF